MKNKSFTLKKIKMRSNNLLFLLILFFGFSCKKFLDVVPDDVATINNAFSLRNEGEKYLFTLYSYLPKNGDGWYNPGLTSADEIWYPQNDQTLWQAAFRIAQGQQNKSDPYFNEWQGIRKGGDGNTTFDYQKIWNGIRNCNIFLENLDNPAKVPDLSPSERSRWIGEAWFLKAFYHYYMLRMYGPIPIVEKNVPIEGDVEANYLNRRPVDECVDSISSWLDRSVPLLPERIIDENSELGRATRSIALAIKAKLLIMAASPLFNGNSDFSNLQDRDGTPLFNNTYEPKKWEVARDAIREAIESAERNNIFLHKYTNDIFGLSNATKTQLSIREAVTKPWNSEVVWGNSNSYFINQDFCMPPVEGGTGHGSNEHVILKGTWAPPLKMAQLFYTSNGVPIEEDKSLDFSHWNELRTAVDSERFNIQKGYITARLNFDREPRFYADLGFDGSVWYMKDGNSTGSDENTFYVKAKNTDRAGLGNFAYWSETGYMIKKLVNWESTTNGTTSPRWVNYPWPEVRLADLFLLYAEAENEVNGGSALAIAYVDSVRMRGGLKGVVESWSQFSNKPNKFQSQDGLREIIHRERTIELMFEGQRFWDLRRWKEAPIELNQAISGWNIQAKDALGYYNEAFIFSQSFISPRDYFWPIGDYDTRRNPKLVENPGW